MTNARSEFEVGFEVTDMFFDRAHVQHALSKHLHSQMWRAGEYTRRAGRKLVKKKNRVAALKRLRKQQRQFAAGKLFGPIRQDIKRSRPGDPPFSWQPEEPNLRTILYSFEPHGESLVVGPVKLERTHTDPPVPNVLEFGGSVDVREYRFPGMTRWVRGRPPKRRNAGWRNRRPAESRTRTSRVAARPFMFPALEKVAPKFPELFFG